MSLFYVDSSGGNRDYYRAGPDFRGTSMGWDPGHHEFRQHALDRLWKVPADSFWRKFLHRSYDHAAASDTHPRVGAFCTQGICTHTHRQWMATRGRAFAIRFHDTCIDSSKFGTSPARGINGCGLGECVYRSALGLLCVTRNFMMQAGEPWRTLADYTRRVSPNCPTRDVARPNWTPWKHDCAASFF